MDKLNILNKIFEGKKDGDFETFKRDFDNVPLSASLVSKQVENTAFSRFYLCYEMGEFEYGSYDFWIYSKDFHLEIAEKLAPAEKLAYLDRMITKMRVGKNEDLEHWHKLMSDNTFLKNNYKVRTAFYEDAEKSIERVIETIELRKKDFERCIKETTTDQPTHREVIIAYNYKVEAGIAEPQKATYWLNERGNNAKIQAYTATKGNKNNTKYKPPTEKELKTVIELLKDCPTAQKIAINKLAELESL